MLFLPAIISEFYLNMAISMIIYSLFALSFNILFGYAGLLSFGHAAYFGVGAYTSIISFKIFNMSLLPGILASGVTGAILGLVFGAFIVRRGGTYFALLTLAFLELVHAGALKWRSLTGGDDGVSATRPDLTLLGIGKIDMFSTVNWYYFVLIIVTLCAVYIWYFTRTPLGKINTYIRESEERAKFIGFNTYITKLLIYTLSSFFAGIAGGLASSFQEFVSVSYINVDKTADVLIMTFIGGGGTYWGPIFGACFLIYLNDFVSSITEHWLIIQGTLFVLLVIYAPKGLSGLMISLKNKLFLLSNK